MIKIGKVFFRYLEFEVPEGIYEPREDSFLAGNYLWGVDLEGKKILDVGTGTGFLGIICNEKGGKVHATDINPKAIKTSIENADRNNLEIDAFESDLFQKVHEKYDIILFNAPYLPGKRDNSNMEEKSWVGGEKGNETLINFLEKADKHLKKSGFILLVFSSISGIKEIFDKINGKNMEYHVIKEEKVDWEKLLLVKCYKF